MLIIDQPGIQDALHVVLRTAQRCTAGMEPYSQNSQRRNRKFLAAGVIGGLPNHKRKLAPMILAHSVEDGSLYAGDSIVAANRFMDWASKDPATDARWQAAYAAVMRVLVNDPNCAPYGAWAQSLARRAMLTGPAAVWIVTGDKSNLYDWSRFVPAFSLVNAGGLDAVTLAAVEEESWM